MDVSGGLLSVAMSLPEHVEQLGAALTAGGDSQAARDFVSTFVRPNGLDRPATPILADAILRLAAGDTVAEPIPGWVPALRPLLFGLALLARAAWSGLRGTRGRPRAVVSLPR